MRKMKFILITCFAVLMSASACAVGPVHGVLFTSTKFAGKINVANDVGSAKSAEGCQHQILGLIAFGNASAGQLAKDNGIKRIATIDHSTVNVLTVIYRQYCTIVSGE